MQMQKTAKRIQHAITYLTSRDHIANFSLQTTIRFNCLNGLSVSCDAGTSVNCFQATCRIGGSHRNMVVGFARISAPFQNPRRCAALYALVACKQTPGSDLSTAAHGPGDASLRFSSLRYPSQFNRNAPNSGKKEKTGTSSVRMLSCALAPGRFFSFVLLKEPVKPFFYR
jgi:hypothetical protein